MVEIPISVQAGIQIRIGLWIIFFFFFFFFHLWSTSIGFRSPYLTEFEIS
jgi:hypothetical protein